MRKLVRAVALLGAVLLSSLAGAQTPPRTWRLDFYETGGPGIEAYSFDRLVVEPLAWPDNAAANVDTRLTGNYRFEVVANGRVIFARGYDPAFAEWVTTAESKQIRRTFQDSLRFPALTAKADVVLKKRSEEGGYKEVWRYAIDPADPFIDRSAPARHQASSPGQHGLAHRPAPLQTNPGAQYGGSARGSPGRRPAAATRRRGATLRSQVRGEGYSAGNMKRSASPTRARQ